MIRILVRNDTNPVDNPPMEGVIIHFRSPLWCVMSYSCGF